MNKPLDLLYKKSELGFALVWIGGYCLLNSLANPLSTLLGVDSSAALLVNAALTAVLLLWIRRRGMTAAYGLCKPSVRAAQFLWYIPLAVFVSHNLWTGLAVNLPPVDTACYIVNMCCVGLLEEIIFRGLLFKAMAKNSVKAAMVVSSLTFGIGHILNLFNGSGMDLVSNICQVTGAVACGFLFVILFYRGGSLIPCIIAHAVNNIVSVFADNEALTDEKQLLISAVSTSIVIVYTLILCKTLPHKDS